MQEHNRNGSPDRRDELILGFVAVIITLMVVPALLGVL
jgi:hypothetical protein